MLAKELESQGYNVKIFSKGTSDAEIIDFAKKNNAIVLTNNIRDFVKKEITTFKVSENMKVASEIENVVKAVEKVNASATADPSVIEKGKNVSLAGYK